ncbi:MAG: HNH endonuclease domain-containing protein [Bacteroidales bacterium]
MDKILGLDLGTNSIGWAVRNPLFNGENGNQLEKYGVTIFKKGVGEGKSGEFSFAAERTNKRSMRRLYQVRKYRLWETLKVLIENEFCPLKIEELDAWRNYKKGIGRKYPLTDSFESWIRLDFNNDGKPDYSSPYQLRADAIKKKLKPYELGRIFYHIAQRRGFKSGRKTGDKENNSVYSGSKDSGAKGVNDIVDFINQTGTLGAALAFIETKGERIRNRYALRKHYEDEIEIICEVQGISKDSDFFKKIVKAIFFQRPLRSQKGLIGKCTLEKNKHRCPASHPTFEEFRAWAFLNNIQFRPLTDKTLKWKQLPLNLRQEIYTEKFFRKSVDYFDFSEIRKFIQVKGYNLDLNYKDKTTVTGCPVSARLKNIFGENWKQVTIGKLKHKDGKTDKNIYTIEDIWHVLFSFDDEDCVKEFASNKIKLDEVKSIEFVKAWKNIPDGYSMLSLNAIKKILPFLKQGFIYTEAVLLANMPEVLGKEQWQENENLLIKSIAGLIQQNRKEKQILNIVNDLIAQYYALNFDDKFGWKNTDYKLDDSDHKQIICKIIDTFGSKSWQTKTEEEKGQILNDVICKYQEFFTNSKREFFKLPKLIDTIRGFLSDNFNISDRQLDKLYHPSQIEIYPHAKPNDTDGKVYLGSPKTGAFKNPMAMRTLHQLRKLINYLIETDQITDDTRIVVELARQLNDKNKRWAIETWQRRREEENQEFAKAIEQLLNEKQNLKANPHSSDDIDKFRLWYEQLENQDGIFSGKDDLKKYSWRNNTPDVLKKVIEEKDLIKKFRLWKEQGCRCIYTGNTINLTDLFDENVIDFEHTIPRSISFDNSLANLTLCYASYNRDIKKKQIPSELPNYNKDAVGYSPILPRLTDWEKKVESIKDNLEFWKKESKRASDKERKDYAIRQRHLWQFDLDYWHNKLNRFKMTEVTSGFKNSQLVDTQLISKYALHYLRTVFNKVDVQKGSITAEFRKIYQIQGDEKKDRSKHSHHAVDAAVLTLIPTAAEREKILAKAFNYYEENRKQYHEKPYPAFNYKQIQQISDDILVNNVIKDQALTPSKKIVRHRGSVVYIRDKNGKLLLDNQGKRVSKIAQGDCIRGQLHLDSFYGKIRVVKRDIEGKPLRDENGNWIYISKNDGYGFVKRRQINEISNINQIVDHALQKIVLQQLNGRTLEKALSEGVYMLDKTGIPIGRPIRHIRCWEDFSELLPIKRQTYLSKYEYKNDYWADNAENYLYGLYSNNDGVKGFRLLNLLDISKLKKFQPISLLSEYFEPSISTLRPKATVELLCVLKVGHKVLFYKNEKYELRALNKTELSERLYIIDGFEKDGRVRFTFHMEARKNDDLKKDLEHILGKAAWQGKSDVNFSKKEYGLPYPKLKLSKDNLNFLYEGKDFEVKPDGAILFKDK